MKPPGPMDSYQTMDRIGQKKRKTWSVFLIFFSFFNTRVIKELTVKQRFLQNRRGQGQVLSPEGLQEAETHMKYDNEFKGVRKINK